MASSILAQLTNFREGTYEVVEAIIAAEDALLKAYMQRVMSWQEYEAARDVLDAATGLQATNAQALDAARLSLATTNLLLKGTVEPC